MLERKRIVRLVWVLILVIGFSLSLGKSVAIAESESQEGDPDSSLQTEPDQGINPNEDVLLKDADQTGTRGELVLEAANYFIIPPSGFVHDGTGSGVYYLSFSEGYLSGTSCMAAAVNLPLGASIEGFEVILKTNTSFENELFRLSRINLETGSVEVIAFVSSPYGPSSGLVSSVTDTVSSPIVSEQYAYQFLTCLNTDINIYGVRIGYSYNSYIPTVQD